MPLNKQFLFSLEGLLMRRANPDGTPSTPERTLGFANTVDLTGFGTSAELTVKINTLADDVQTVDYSAAVDQSAVTVAEMVTAINAAGFTDITASADSTTGRLKIVYSGAGTPTYLQVFDGVDTGFAAALDFGNGQKYGGNGTEIVKALDNLATAALPLRIKDKEEIEKESSAGDLRSVIIEALTKGLDPVLTFHDEDFKIKQLVMGGIYDETENSYTPPTTKQTNKPVFTTEIFVSLYSGASNFREDRTGYKRTILWSCTGNEGDSTNETKVIADVIFNLSVAEYKDENGDTIPYKKEINLTPEQYEAFDIENL